MSTKPKFPRGLYGVTPEWDDTDRLIAAIEAAAKGGMAALQWRRKTAALDQRLPQALALAERCKALGVLFIVNDDYRFALATNADGVHMGREDGSLAEARKALGPHKIIGSSCYNDLDLARRALQANVDYIAFGAMYPSSVKPDAVRATLDHIRLARELIKNHPSPTPATIVAIGGLTADNAGPVVDAGADNIALISGLFGAADIQATAARCQALFTRSPQRVSSQC
ncbi:MAG TPA: thiamine phosphate synthase [Eoetvoesiella sp.]